MTVPPPKPRSAPPFRVGKPLTPSRIYEELDRYVIGQERAKRVVAVGAYNHLKRVRDVEARGRSLIKKSNILLIGPTGVGKTHLARNLATVLDLPFASVDITEYTEAGYYGKDVEVMIGELLHAAGGDVAATQRGVVFVDELDKVARRAGGMRTGAGARDIGGEGVQQALLKILEGQRIFVPINITQHWNKHDFVEVDTSNILFICAGTFTDIREYYRETGEMGFSEVPGGASQQRIRRVTHRQLLEYGMLAELLGRIPVVAQLDALSEEDLLRILQEPPDSLVKEYKALLKADEVDLDFSEQALYEIACFATRRKVGARGLRAIMEEVLHDVLFEAPDRDEKTILLDQNFIREKLKAFDSGMVEL